MVKKWIQKAKPKKGTLSRQLGIPESENIPYLLLYAIRSAKVGTKITNPTTKGKRIIPITRLLKRRVALAITLKRM